MKIAMVGQPNSGKSTIFNAVAGYKSISSNFPGTTVRYAKSTVRMNGLVSDLVDFPGSYSLSSANEVGLEVRDQLIATGFDVIIDVVDASQLGRGLPLTMELLELNIPMVLCLNMMDDASRKGISFDMKRLSDMLGIPVVPTIGSKDIGVKKLFAQVHDASNHNSHLKKNWILYPEDVEELIGDLTQALNDERTMTVSVPPRFLAIKLLEDDKCFIQEIQQSNSGALIKKARQSQHMLSAARREPPDTALAMERNAQARDICHKVTTVGPPRKDWRDGLDDLLMHRVWGYIFMSLILAGTFYGVFAVGATVETPLLAGFTRFEAYLGEAMGTEGFRFVLAKNALYGISGGVAIVLPYLIPFLVVLTILEDIGYLPRVAYLLDSLMHRIGLHGSAIVPILLGYGCSVPAVMATRILPTRRDRTIAAVLATLVPCSARSVVIYGLVAYFLGASAALLIYILNIIVVVSTGKMLSSLMPEVSPGMIMEVPRYQWPTVQTILHKVWFRIREFVVIAWPLLILGSVVLGIVEFLNWDAPVNGLLSPLTVLLGLPAAVGITLIFGVLRKELVLVMLIQALGTQDVLSVLTPAQVMVFAVFVTFYVPCVATIAILRNELGVGATTVVVGITLLLATGLALLTRLGCAILW